MRIATIVLVVLPLVGNWVLAIAGFFFLTADYTGNLRVCWEIALFASAAAGVSLGGFCLHDIGPGRTLLALVGQAMALIVIFAGIYRGYGLSNVPPLLSHELALYFSIVTWTTLGYGDFSPPAGLRLIAGLQGLLGYVFLGLIVGLGNSFINSREAPTERGAKATLETEEKQRS